MNFAAETLYEVIEEVQPLLERHYEELCPNKDLAKLDPCWDVYAELERLNAFCVFTAREEQRLEGYAAFFVNRHMHYAGLTIAQNDVFWIEPAHRAGMTPARFVRFCEQQLAQRGARKVIYHCKLTNNLAPLLNRLGYRDEETMCAKVIGA